MTLQQPRLAEIDKDMLPSFPLVLRRGDRQPDHIAGQDLDLSLRDSTAVANGHETETHDDGDAVQSGGGVEVVPGGDEGVAV